MKNITIATNDIGEVEITSDRMIAGDSLIAIINQYMIDFECSKNDLMINVINQVFENQEEAYTLQYIDCELYINNTLIPQEISDSLEWSVREKDDFINDLCMFISEASRAQDSRGDLQLMKDDLEYIIGQEDELFFSSQSTNTYLFKSEDGDILEFNALCKEMIELAEKDA